MFDLDGPPSESHGMTRFYSYFNGKYFNTPNLKACSLGH